MKNATRLFFQMPDNRFVTMENVMHNRFDDENFGLFEMCKEIERVSVVERCINSISGSIERERERGSGEWLRQEIMNIRVTLSFDIENRIF